MQMLQYTGLSHSRKLSGQGLTYDQQIDGNVHYKYDSKYVTGFAKRGLIHASNFSILRRCT